MARHTSPLEVVEICLSHDGTYMARLCPYGSDGGAAIAVGADLADVEARATTVAQAYSALLSNYEKSVSVHRRFYAHAVYGASRWGATVHPRNMDRPPVYNPYRAFMLPVTPNDSVNLDRPRACKLWAVYGGNAEVVYETGATATLVIPSGTTALDVAPVNRIRATGTTARGIVAIYDGIPFPQPQWP